MIMRTIREKEKIVSNASMKLLFYCHSMCCVLQSAATEAWKQLLATARS